MISLHEGRNIPSVLQALGCISQYSFSTYELYDKQITQFIVEKIFCSLEAYSSLQHTSLEGDLTCSSSCKLKIYGMKMLVKSFLSRQIAHVRPQMRNFLDILLGLIQERGVMSATSLSEDDEVHLRLNAAKSILRLATRWDLYISPNIFHLTILRSRDPSSSIRKSFMCKVHKLLKNHALPNRYACAFALASLDYLADVRTDSIRYLTDFIKDHKKDVHVQQNLSVYDADGSAMTNCSEYIIVFLVHVLAHDEKFPSENCQDDDAYAEFCSPLIAVLRALVDLDCVDNNKIDASNTISFLLGIFRAIKKAEDAVDFKLTPRLHILSDVGLSTLKVLSHQCKSLSTTPRVVLLPSSLYKVCKDTGDRGADTHDRRFLDEIFAKKIIDSFETYVARPAGPDTRRVKSQENTKNLDSIKNISNSISLKRQADSLLGKSKSQKDTLQTRGKRIAEVKSVKVGSKVNLMLISADSSESSEPVPGSFAVHESTNLKPKTDNPILVKEQLSLCGSVSTNLSLADSVLPMQAEHEDCIPHEPQQKQNMSTRFPTDQTKFTNGITHNCLGSKMAGDKGDELVGKRIRLWSPIDMCFNSGTVNLYDSQNSTYKVVYDNGEVELLHLDNENWEAIDSRTLPDKGCDFRPRECFFRKGLERTCSNVSESTKHPHDASSTVWLNSSSSSHEDAVYVLGKNDSQGPSAILDEISGHFDNRIVPPTGAVKGNSERPVRKASLKKNRDINVVDKNTYIVTRSRSTRARRT